MLSVLYNLYGSSGGVRANVHVDMSAFFWKWYREVKGKSFQEKARPNPSTHGMYTVLCRILNPSCLLSIFHMFCVHIRLFFSVDVVASGIPFL